MTCRELADFIVDYVAGELPRDVCDPFERHLAICVDCETYLRQYAATIEAARRTFAHETAGRPPEMPEELVRAILDAVKTKRPPS